jgi:hypothetical protein
MTEVIPFDSTNYDSLVSLYNANTHNQWGDWLRFNETFEKPGKQGLVGTLKTKETGEKCVFKISQYINDLIQHERLIMDGLNQLSPFCPHFVRSLGIVQTTVDPKNRKSGNPFDISTKYPIKKDALLCEYLNNSCKFYNYIRSQKVDEDVLYSTVKQVLMAIEIAQRKKKFTHYDLHSFNIMMKKCDKDLVFLYVLDEDNQFCVPTNGCYPVIIDFGFSYIEDMEDQPMWTTLAHTDVGFMSDRFDWVADPKLFLVSVAHEIKDKRQTKTSKKFGRIVKNMFYPLEIDWECGWDDVDDSGAADYVTDMLENLNIRSTLFDKFPHYCIDILQSLIILPLQKQNYTNMDKAYKAFLTEWQKIEDQISSQFYNLQVLKGVVDAARHVRPGFLRKSSRETAVVDFQRLVYEKLNEVSSFCMPKNLSFDKLLCSMLVLATNIEGVLFDVMKVRMSEKQKQYDELPLQSVVQMYAAITTNIPDKYVWNKNTKVCVLDCVNGTKKMIDSIPDDVISEINDTHPLCIGSDIYNLYNKDHDAKL